MREPTGPHGKADNLMLKYIAAAARICIKISLTLATRPNKQVKQMGEILVKKLLHTNCNTKRCIHSKCNTFFLETKYYPSVWPKYIQATNTNFSKSVNFKQASSPSQTQTIFNSKNLKRKKKHKTKDLHRQVCIMFCTIPCSIRGSPASSFSLRSREEKPEQSMGKPYLCCSSQPLCSRWYQENKFPITEKRVTGVASKS